MSVQHAPRIRLATTPVDWDQATAMLWDYVVWIRAAIGIDLLIEQPSFAAEPEAPAEHYDGADSVLFIAYNGALAVGTVALRCHDDGTAELKRGAPCKCGRWLEGSVSPIASWFQPWRPPKTAAAPPSGSNQCAAPWNQR